MCWAWAGGFLAVPALVNVVGLRMRAAVGTSLLVITVNSPAASAARAGMTVGVVWGAVAPVAGIALLGAGGAAGAWRQGVRRRTFAVAPPAVAAFLLADAL